ncbi:hypothetical protein CRENBAI_002931 [Crenichthys baileyi]|uniref:Uncharacterized protein n=1 Tax=Crenichthys baileyi TaxID=28760 RepID=A0AAV9RNL1_9TELE
MDSIEVTSSPEHLYLLSWLSVRFQGSSGFLRTNLAHPPPCSPSKITHQVPPLSQVQVRQDYLDRSLTRHTPGVSVHLSPPLADLQVTTYLEQIRQSSSGSAMGKPTAPLILRLLGGVREEQRPNPENTLHHYSPSRRTQGTSSVDHGSPRRKKAKLERPSRQEMDSLRAEVEQLKGLLESPAPGLSSKRMAGSQAASWMT